MIRGLSTVLIFISVAMFGNLAQAACGANDIFTANGSSTYWSSTTTWSPANVPDNNTENAIISAGGTAGYTWVYPNNFTVGCVEVVSGLLALWNRSLTVQGDYLRSLIPGGIYYGRTDNNIIMDGSGPQTLEVKSTFPNLEITNDTSVTFTEDFKTLNAFVISSAAVTIFIDNDYEIINASDFTVPAGTTVYIRNGAKFTANGNITVNGTLILESGAILSVGNGRTLSIGAGGFLRLEGSPGNVATIKSDGSFTFNVAGNFNADYFRISNTTNNGLNMTGTIGQIDNGEFHFLANGGRAITLGPAASVPPVWDSVGFFNDSGHATNFSVNTAGWTAGSASAVTINNWNGDRGGENFDQDTGCGADPPGCVTWGTEAGVTLAVSNNTAAGNPPVSLNSPSAETLFGTFAFSLTGASAATDITQLTFTQTGTANASEVGTINLYADGGASNCTYEGGDTLIASGTLSGSPQTVTFNLSPGQISTSNPTPSCVHLRTSVTASGVRDHTISFSLQNTSDIINSTGYDFSVASGPPLSTDATRINTGFAAIWKGTGNWNTNGNWFSPLPSATRDCQVGVGSGNTNMNVSGTCRNALLLNGGTIDFLNSTRTLSVRASLDVGDSYNFLNAANARIVMNGSVRQDMKIGTSFPGGVDINNSGTAGNDIVDVTSGSTIEGNLRVQNGSLRIGSGTTLTVEGNVTVSSGAQLEIEPGGVLELADNSVLTIDAGGSLVLVGTSGLPAGVTSINASSSYNVVVNGSISANHYSFSRLGGNGVTINAGATINATNHLQNGSFNFPVSGGTQMLRLFRTVPTDSIDSISFNSAGSAAGGITNILTGPAVTAGTLAITNYSGDLSGETLDSETNYLVDWSAASNSLEVLTETTTPANLPAGSSQNMVRFSLKQELAGTFNDTDITSIKITHTGTASGSDIDLVKLFSDFDCNGSGGTVLSSGTLSGSPASVTLNISAGDFTVLADAASPAKNCFYIEYDIASAAGIGLTAGVKIDSSTHILNTEGYTYANSFPVTSGTPGSITGSDRTIWIGATDTDWFTASNWTNGVPNASINCEIPFASNNPTINAAAFCKTVEVTSGVLTMTAGRLEVNGGLINTGTIIQNDRWIEMQDNYATATDQVISSTTTLERIRFDKRAGGTVSVGSNPLSITNLNLTTGENFTFRIPAGKRLEAASNINIRPGITFRVEGGGTLAMANNRFFQNLGGNLVAAGINDPYPQGTTNKATFTSISGRFRMRSTSGNNSLTGFIIDNLHSEGLRIEGSSNLTAFDGGQFTNMAQIFTGTVVRGLRLNTTVAISETVASNIGFNFGPANSTYNNPPSPLPAQNYHLVHAGNCGSQTLTFDNWFGDFWGTTPQPVTEDKIIDLDDGAANTCQINMDVAASPVQLLGVQATPYNQAVDIAWQTASEVNHFGFNVYRSQTVNGQFTQINTNLIRNFQHSHLGEGNYLFRDSSVFNGQSYFYYIEDVGANGSTTMHGPVTAIPLSVHNMPPSYSGNESGTGENSENDGDDRSPDSYNNGVNLGGGILVLSQTINSLRVKVNVASMTFTPSAWNSDFYDVSIATYGKTQTEDIAQTLERVILIEVDPSFTSAQLSDSEVFESSPVTHKLSPAPRYQLNPATNVLEPSYQPDASYYALGTYQGNEYFEIENNLINQGQKRFLKLTIKPVKYLPASELVKQATEITLDIGLDGNAWDWQPAANVSEVTPEAFENVLKIKYSKTGMYEMSFEDIDDLGLSGPFAGEDTSEFRMYYHGKEIPIELIGGSPFGPGSKIRYYANFSESLEDHFNEIILSPAGVFNESLAPLRINSVDGTPTSSLSEVLTHNSSVTFEEDKYYQQDLPVGGHVEHVYWKRLLRGQGSGPSAGSQLDITASLPEIDLNNSGNIDLIIYVRGRPAVIFNPTHRLEVYVNGVASGSVDFESKNYRAVSLSLPITQFAQGPNALRLEASDQTLVSGDFNIIDIDKVVIKYPRFNSFENNQLVIGNPSVGENISASNFITPPNIYDISQPYSVFKVDNAISEIEDGLHTMTFLAQNYTDPNSPTPVITGTRFSLVNDDQFYLPDHMDLSAGYTSYLKSLAQKADLIVIAPKGLLASTEEYINYRRSQGLAVVGVSLEQIYDEFSHGNKNSQAIKDFLLYAHANWQRPAVKYALFVGDSSIDFKDKLALGTNFNKWPARLIHGKHLDYDSDAWFVTPRHETTGEFLNPIISTGRIPTSNPALIERYFTKVINYELGLAQPDVANLNSFLFISGSDQRGEQFNSRNLLLAATLNEQNGSLGSSILNISDYANGSELKSDIINSFNNDTPLMMTYYGHGAEDRWGDDNYFNSSDIASLTNTQLPMVLALNCINANFASFDDSQHSLGENLIASENGAITFFGSTSLTSPGNQMTLSTDFMAEMSKLTQQVYQGQRVGDLLFKVQSQFPINEGNQDVLLSWTLLGDPALKIPQNAFSGVAPSANNESNNGSGGGGGCGLIKTPPSSNTPGSQTPLNLFYVFMGLLLLPLGLWTHIRHKAELEKTS